ncbi:helix-turn-helix domain-containing protein [Sphingomonas sp. NY01]|uniref:Ada metal-binding domain-containing protein n=1 Tax=Sphingomonas sp. NY01 TaxID=2968057 RepID=UPI00315DC2D3
MDEDRAWIAFASRDRDADGRFVVAVRSTGIYCRPSCPARRPARDKVAFYKDAADAKAAGYRSCRRCHPDTVARDATAVARAAAMLARDGAVPLDRLAQAVGYAPHHFHRLFKRATGVTPAAYARALRSGRAIAALAAENSVTEAIYAAGHDTPSRFYAADAPRLGMSPSAWRHGGRGRRSAGRWSRPAWGRCSLLRPPGGRAGLHWARMAPHSPPASRRRRSGRATPSCMTWPSGS